MNKVEVKFNFDTDIDCKNFFYELSLHEITETSVCMFQESLYQRLRRKKYSKDLKEIQLLKEILDEYNNMFCEIVSPLPEEIDIEQEKPKEEKLKEKNT